MSKKGEHYRMEEVQLGETYDEVGVLNPRLLMKIERRHLRVGLFNVVGYGMIKEHVQKKIRVNSYAVFGDIDMICESFDETASSLPDEVMARVGTPVYIDMNGYYTVKDYYRYFGKNFEDLEFDSNITIGPGERDAVECLTKKWSDPAVPQATRDTLVKANVIFPATKRKGINAYMWVSVLGNISEHMLTDAIPKWILDAISNNLDDVTGLFSVVGRPQHFQFLLKINASNITDLRDIIDKTNGLYKSFGFKIFTRTYVALETLCERPVLLGGSSTERTYSEAFRTAYEIPAIEKITSLLSRREFDIVKGLGDKQRKKVFRKLTEAHMLWEEIPERELELVGAMDLLQRSKIDFSRAIVTAELAYYMSAFMSIASCIERNLAHLLHDQCVRKYEDEIEAQKVLVLPDRNILSFTLGNTVKALSKWNKKFPKEYILSDKALTTIDKIVNVRNDCAHGRLEKFDTSILEDTYLSAIRWINSNF